jgi:hypothetical protein
MENPLRQVIINTHSPVVVSALDINDLLMARLIRRKGVSQTLFECVENTWRAKFNPAAAIPPGTLLAYVSEAPDIPVDLDSSRNTEESIHTTVKEYSRKQQIDIFGAERL